MSQFTSPPMCTLAALPCCLLMLTTTAAAQSEVPPGSDVTRLTWLSECEQGVEFFRIDVFPDGELRYEGLAGVKTLGTRTAQVGPEAAARLEQGAKRLLAEKKADKSQFCIQLKRSQRQGSFAIRNHPVSTARPSAALRVIDDLAAAKKWACPARLASHRGGFPPALRSTGYCDEQPAIMMTAAGASACELTRHVEIYLDGTIYVATYGPQLIEVRDHSYYEVPSSAVAELVETIKPFETSSEQIETAEGLVTHYYRARAQDVQRIKTRLAELASLDWTQPPAQAPCQGSRPESKITLRRDLDAR